ncbi:MAG: mechanosensitive ion channel family protein, partial [Desulfotignum sp.]|nr:mechanosensitive ion channel family protein [Desulfotignum sp.]
KQATSLLLRTAGVAIGIFGVLTVADQLQINIKSLLAGVGIMGLAISFAAKDTISNIISGIVIIIDKPFRENDWIVVGSMHAMVSEIRLRTTVLTTFDNETVVVPNQQISQERIINYTMTPRSRVKVSVGIAYKEDIDKARKIILETLQGDTRILPEPAPAVVVTGLADSSVNLQLRFWVANPLDQFSFVWEYTEKSKKALDRAGIEIPYPHLQLFVENTDGIKQLAMKKDLSPETP